MNNYLLKKWQDFHQCEEGATLVEYGIAITLAITLGGGALATLGGAIGTSMGTATGLMP